MPIQYITGNPYPRIHDPVFSTVANKKGLYPWSVISAYLGLLDDDDIVQDDTLTGSTVDILIFGQDFPASASLLATDLTALLQFQSDVSNTLSVPFLVTISGGAAPVTASNYGQVLRGYAGAASAVRVSGFPAQVTIGAPGVAGAVDAAKLICITNGSSLISPIGPVGIADATAAAPTPIVLLESDYTAAILAAGNLLTDGSGNLYMVVGLYLAVAVPA